MKKFLLSILLLGGVCAHSQTKFSDYQDFIREKIANEDSIRIAGIAPKFSIYTQLFNPGTPMKDIFGQDPFDRTTDNLYFTLHPNYYKVYIPESHTLFTISSLLPDADIGNHFLWLTNELRKYKKESFFKTTY